MGFAGAGSRALCLAAAGLTVGVVGAFACADDAQAMTVRQVNATTDSIALEFTPGLQEEIVSVTGVEAKTYDTGEWVAIDGSYIESLTIKGAKLINIEPGSLLAQVKIHYQVKYGGSSVAIPSEAVAYDCVSVPEAGFGLKISGQLHSTKKVKLSFSNPGAIGGYQIKLVAASGKKDNVSYSYKYPQVTLSGKKRITTPYIDLKFNTVYKAKVRSWVNMRDDSKTKKYGKWSTTTVLVPEPDFWGKRTSSGAKLSWNKIKGATSYSVYASTKKSSGFKKVATTKSDSATIKKIAGKKLSATKHYYFYVKAISKQGKKTYSSPAKAIYAL